MKVFTAIISIFIISRKPPAAPHPEKDFSQAAETAGNSKEPRGFFMPVATGLHEEAKITGGRK